VTISFLKDLLFALAEGKPERRLLIFTASESDVLFPNLTSIQAADSVYRCVPL